MALTNEHRTDAVRTLLEEVQKRLPGYSETDQRQLVYRMDQLAFNACEGSQEKYVKKLSSLWGSARKKAALANLQAGPGLDQQTVQQPPPGQQAGAQNQQSQPPGRVSPQVPQEAPANQFQAQQQQPQGLQPNGQNAYNHVRGGPQASAYGQAAPAPWQQPQATQQRLNPNQAGPSYPMSQDQIQASIASLNAQGNTYQGQPGMQASSNGPQLGRQPYQPVGQNNGLANHSLHHRQGHVTNPGQQGYQCHPPQNKALTTQTPDNAQTLLQKHQAFTSSLLGAQGNPTSQQQYPFSGLQGHPMQRGNQPQYGPSAGRQAQYSQQPPQNQQYMPTQQYNPRSAGDYRGYPPMGSQQANPYNNQQWAPNAPPQPANGAAPYQSFASAGGRNSQTSQQSDTRSHHSGGVLSQPYPTQSVQSGGLRDAQPRQFPDLSRFGMQQSQYRQQPNPETAQGGNQASQVPENGIPSLGDRTSGDFSILPASPSMQQMIHGLILNKADPRQQQPAGQSPQSLLPRQQRPAQYQPSMLGRPQAVPQTNQAPWASSQQGGQYQSVAHQQAYQQQRQGASANQGNPNQAGLQNARIWPGQAPYNQVPANYQAHSDRQPNQMPPVDPGQSRPPGWNQPSGVHKPGGFLDLLNDSPTPGGSQMPERTWPNADGQQVAGQHGAPAYHPQPGSAEAATTEQYWQLLGEIQQKLVPVLEPFLNRLKLNDQADPHQAKVRSIKEQILPRLKISRENPHYKYRIWTQKHVDQIALLQKQLSSYAAKCLEYDQKVQKARRNAGQLSVQGQMGHTDLSPGSPPPLSPLPNDAAGSPPTPEDAKYGQVAEETNFNQQLKQESQASEANPVPKVEPDMKIPVPESNRRQKLLNAASMFAQAHTALDLRTQRILDSTSFIVPEVPACLQSLGPKLGQRQAEGKRKAVKALEAYDERGSRRSRDLPVMSEQTQKWNLELQSQCRQISQSLPGDVRLDVIPGPREEGLAVQMSPNDSNLSAHTDIERSASRLQSPGEALADWRKVTFEMARNSSTEVKSTMMEPIAYNDKTFYQAMAAQNLFEEGMAETTREPRLEDSVLAWNAAVTSISKGDTLSRAFP